MAKVRVQGRARSDGWWCAWLACVLAIVCECVYVCVNCKHTSRLYGTHSDSSCVHEGVGVGMRVHIVKCLQSEALVPTLSLEWRSSPST